MGANKLTKPQIVTALAEACALDKGSINRVLDALGQLVAKQLGKDGPGEITLPGLVKLTAKATAATPERETINPFTKEKVIQKAKPASVKVKASPVKQLKDAAAAAAAK